MSMKEVEFVQSAVIVIHNNLFVRVRWASDIKYVPIVTQFFSKTLSRSKCGQ